jgi:ssDNA-binding Zn-finger/Zn-ribbon topoisomerase 1
MVRRLRGSDGVAFWGCSDFPRCRGTRELVTDARGDPQPAAAFSVRVRRDVRPGKHFDRLVLACGAIGLLIGLGFIVVGFTVGPSTYRFIGAAALFLVAISVLPAPFLAPEAVRDLALRAAFLLVFLAMSAAAWRPDAVCATGLARLCGNEEVGTR